MLGRDNRGLANAKQQRVDPSLAGSAVATAVFSRTIPEHQPPSADGEPRRVTLAGAGATVAAAVVLQASSEGDGDDEPCDLSTPALPPPPPPFEGVEDSELFQDADESISSSSSSVRTGGRIPQAVRGKASFRQRVIAECIPKLRLSASGKTLTSEFPNGKSCACQITDTSSTFNQRDGETHKKSDFSIPSDNAMSTRLEKALTPLFTPFQDIFRRGKSGKKTEAEFWVDSVQKKLQKHLLARYRFEIGTLRPSKLSFVTVFNSKWKVAVSCEEQCPGMLKATFENLNEDIERVLQLSAFSPSMDYNSALAALSSQKSVIPAQKKNWARHENSLGDEFTKLIQSFEIDQDVSVAAVYKLANKQKARGKPPVGAASLSSAEPTSTDSPHRYYQSRKFLVYPAEQFKSTFEQKLALYSSLGSQDYALSVLGCTLMGRGSEGYVFFGLGFIGQKILLDVIRDLTYSGHECDVSEVSREVLYELGLVSSSQRLPRSQRRAQAQLNGDASAGGGGGST
jgi:hypothetical protein